MPSYHDLHITTPKIKRTSIFNLPFRVRVTCSRVAGWQAWAGADRPFKDELIGSEYGLTNPLCLDVAGHVICCTDGYEPDKED